MRSYANISESKMETTFFIQNVGDIKLEGVYFWSQVLNPLRVVVSLILEGGFNFQP